MLLPDYEELVSLRHQTGRTDFGGRAKVASAHLGGHASLFKGRGLDFSEFREYTPGDDIRSIDWRVTARTGRAHTKLFIEERERSVFVIVDTNRYMEFGTRGTFKSIQAARAAAHIVWRAHALHDRVGAIVFGGVPERTKLFVAKRSRKSIWELFKLLCAPKPNREDIALSEAVARGIRVIPSGSAVFLISDFLSLPAEFEKQLALLANRREVTLVRVTDPADRHLPPVSEVRFRDNDGHTLLIDTNARAGSQHYERLWAENERKLRELARRYRVKTISLATDRDVSSDFFRAIHQPAGGDG